MKHLRAALVALWVLALSGCAALHAAVVATENTLAAGQAGVDRYVAKVVEGCREKNLPTPEERAACAKPATDLLDKTDPALEAAAAAIRAYWSAVAAKDSAGMRKALDDLHAALEALPPEHFGGAARALRGAL